eukprot:TRINITY_DN7874_c0_g1_i1.p1 TRINITY_DN7874_c0_g1~~TRINITY_DN7874_c0_g1_i1.p1  ORF type:complete len:442 (-),score=47.69 TRINITY_DN7874_c0_g1_i1:24-1325(-)
MRRHTAVRPSGGLVVIAVISLVVLSGMLASSPPSLRHHRIHPTELALDRHRESTAPTVATVNAPPVNPVIPAAQPKAAKVSERVPVVAEEFQTAPRAPPSGRTLNGATPPRDKETSNRQLHPHHEPQQLCLVLTTRTGDAEGFPRLPSLLESVVKFMAPGMIHTLFLLVPDGDFLTFSNAVRALQRYLNGQQPRFRIVVLRDSSVLTSPNRETYVQLTPPLEKANGGRGTGYRIQMLLKIGVAAFVPTEYYLTMDSDVFVRRNVTFSDLVVNGRAVFQGENTGNTRHQQRWWQSADRVLRSQGCVRHGEPVIGVTPAIMSTTISQGLMQEVSRLHGSERESRWDVLLFKLLSDTDWTEYTLYWTYGCKAGMLQRYHTLSPKGLKLYDYSGFEYGSHTNWRPRFGDPSSVFGVLQSISGANAQWVHSQLAPGLA